MAGINYTPAQKTAVFWRGGNLLLSAAAGSGKTAALTGRIAELCKKGEDLHSMLIVTFTRSAAAEMRTRISSALAKAVEEYRETDPAAAGMISRAIAKVPSAEISTIHSFLYHTLKPYFPALGLPQDSRIADQKMTDALQIEIMTDVVDEFFSCGGERGERFTVLADIIGQVRDTSTVDGELLWLAKRLTSGGQDQNALLVYADMLDSLADGGNLMDSEYGKVLRDTVGEFFAHYRKVFGVLEDEFAALPIVAEKYGPTLASAIEWIERGQGFLTAQPCDFDRLAEHFNNMTLVPLKNLSAKHACDTSAAFKIFRDEMSKSAEKLCKNFFSGTQADASRYAGETADVLRLCAEVLGVYFDSFARRKREMSLIDYGDLENLALRLLIDENGDPTPAAMEIGEKYKYIFIDEYQDTNLVQDKIFRAISKNARRFMVGDIKQSIYRFRGADPEVFSYYRQIWETADPIEDIEAMADTAEFDPEDGNSLFMSENFRCDEPITRMVNMVSDYMLSHGGIPYGEKDALVYAKNSGMPLSSSPAAEITLIDTKSASNEEDGSDGDNPKAAGDPEAEYVARRIAGMIGKYSPHGDRIVKAGDIAILLRSPSSNGAQYRDALEKYGISCMMKVERPLSSFPSVMLLICILNFIDNPLRDIYVTGALRSPIFGFTMSELVAIKGDSDSPLYLSVLDRSALGDEKCASCVRWLEKQKTVSRGMRVDKYLEYLIDETGLYSLEGIREMGSERDAVNRLCSLAAEFEAGSTGVTRNTDISSFLSYAADALDSGDSENSTSGGENAVSIMSIHASKGLEFPVCFVCGCAKRRNAKDESRTVLHHRSLGFGMYLPDKSRLVKCDTLIRRIIAEKVRQDSVSEEMRMLYVALTRGREQLIVTAKVADAEKKLASARLQAEFSDGYRVTGISSYIDWILESAAAGSRDWLKLNVISADKIGAGEEDISPAEDDRPDRQAEATPDEYLGRFEFAYPHAYLEGVPSKLTVSRLNPQILDDGEVGVMLGQSDGAEEAPARTAKRPAFMSEGQSSSTAADRGTATHVFMQFADFAALRKYGAREEITRLISERYITEDTARLINLRQIERFADSALMDKLLRSHMIKREFRFNALLGGERFTGNVDLANMLRENGVKLTVQGVVDCVFRDPDTGRLVLIDYKTDSLTEKEWKDQSLAEEKLRTRHRDQLSYYREICSEMFEDEISETYIYSTVLGRCVEI